MKVIVISMKGVAAKVRDLSFREIYNFHFNKFIKNVNLDDEKKSKLIEILLIVGSILVALKTLQSTLLIVFYAFILSSIFYYIFIQKDNLEPSFWLNLIVLTIAVSFSTLVNVNLFISIGSSLASISSFSGKILYLIYYAVLSLILYAALAKR